MRKLEELQQGIFNELAKRPAMVDKLDRLWDAAVLLPLVETTDGPSLLFEVRAANLKRQPGQICFPGGKFEASDKTLATTVLRETCEELGLERQDIELLGELDHLVTFSGPVIHPFVGTILHPEKIVFNTEEVAEVFTVPLQFFIDNEPKIYKMDMADKPEANFPFDLVPHRKTCWRYYQQYNVYFYLYQHYVIWGMTGRILYSFILRHQALLQQILEKR